MKALAGFKNINKIWSEYRPDKLLYPDRCYLCNEILPDEGTAGVKHPCLCPDCESHMPYVRTFCLKCGRLYDGGGELCGQCREISYSFDAGRSLLVYTDEVSEMISRYKFHNMRHYADWFAEAMADRLSAEIRAMHADVITTVPLHPQKLAARGFDQTKLLAEKLSAMTGIPLVNLLVRTRATRPMKELTYESRVLNMTSAMAMNPKYLRGIGHREKELDHECNEVAEKTHIPHRVLLVDDIFTTGSTVDSCAKVLKRAGVEKVFFITAATGRTQTGAAR